MKPTKLAGLAVAIACGTPVHAFVPYIIEGHTAQHKPHVADAISKGFAFLEKDHVDQNALLGKATLRKRAHTPINPLNKRVNDFKVETDNPPSQKQSAAIDQDGTDFSYFAEVTINNQQLYMMLDTGSSAIWVMGQDCSSDACKSHQLSSSSNLSDSPFSLSYSSGTVSGKKGTDQLSFAGLNLDVTLGLADQTSDEFDKYPMDGILGLARSASGTDFAGDTFLQSVANASALPANVFGMWLDRAGGPKDGEINFGSPDSTRYSGDLNYIDTDMTDLTVWKIQADDLLVDGKSAGLSDRMAIVDSGTTYMFVPPSDADAIFKDVEGATLPSGSDMYNIPCDTTANISVVFNGIAYEVSPKDYVGPSVSSGVCYTHIIGQAAAGDDSTWLLGATFLKNVYTVFDMDQNRIGFGLPAQSAQGGNSTTSAGAPAQSASPSEPAGGMGPAQATGSAKGGPSHTGAAAPKPTSPDDEDAMGTIGAAGALDSGRAAMLTLLVAAAVGLLL